MNLYFTYESRDTLKSLTLFINVKAIAKLNLGHRNKFEIEFYKISRLSSRRFFRQRRIGHFTLLFCRGRQRNVKSYNARAQPLSCSLNLLFIDVPVAVAVVVFLGNLSTDDGDVREDA